MVKKSPLVRPDTKERGKLCEAHARVHVCEDRICSAGVDQFLTIG